MIKVWPILVIGTAYLVLLGGSGSGVDATGIRLVNVLVLAGVIGAWALAAYRDPRWRPAAVLWPAIAVVLLALLVATLTSRSTRLSQDVLAHAVILGGLYLLLRQLMTDGRPRRLVTGTVTVLSFALAILYLLAVLARWVGWWLLVGAPAVPPLGPGGEGLVFGSPDAMAGIAVLGLAVGAAHLGPDGRRERRARIALLALTAAVVVVSGSVVAWVSLAVTGAVLAASRLRREAPHGEAPARLGRRARRRLLAAAAIAVMVFAVVAGPGIAARFITSGQAAERVSLGVVSARMLVYAPVTGTGPGTWADERIAHTEAPEMDAYVPDPGSGWLRTASEIGVIGIAALVFAAWCLVALAGRALADADPARRRWGGAAVLSVVYLAAHQVLGVLTLPAALFLAAVPVAWLDATEARPLRLPARLDGRLPARLDGRLPAFDERVQAFVLGAGLVLVAVAIGWTGLTERSAIGIDQGRGAIEANDWAGALGPLGSAADTDPDMPATLLPLALARAHTGDAPSALATLTRLTDGTDLPIAWIDRAWLEIATGNEVAARRSLELGLRLGGQQPALAFAAGWIYEQLGDVAESNRWYTEVLVLEPRLGGDPFWESTTRVARWDTIRIAALGRLTAAGAADLWLSAGDTDAAAAAVAAMPAGDARALMELVVPAWADAPGARDALARYARDHATDLDVVAWSARVAAYAGDTAAAQRYRDWAAVIAAGRPIRATGILIELPPISTAPKAGLTSLAWGTATYRRPTPAIQLLADLPQLATAP